MKRLGKWKHVYTCACTYIICTYTYMCLYCTYEQLCKHDKNLGKLKEALLSFSQLKIDDTRERLGTHKANLANVLQSDETGCFNKLVQMRLLHPEQGILSLFPTFPSGCYKHRGKHACMPCSGYKKCRVRLVEVFY